MMRESIELPDRQAEFIREAIASGKFDSVSEAIRAGIVLLEERLAEEARREAELRVLLEEGIASGLSEKKPEDVWAAVEAKYRESDA